MKPHQEEKRDEMDAQYTPGAVRAANRISEIEPPVHITDMDEYWNELASVIDEETHAADVLLVLNKVRYEHAALDGRITQLTINYIHSLIAQIESFGEGF